MLSQRFGSLPVWLGGCAAALLLALPASAQTVVTNGSAVAGSGDLQANFEVSDGTMLGAYSEGGLDVFLPGVKHNGFSPTGGLPGFNGGFHYVDTGSNQATRIKASAGTLLSGVEFNIGNGWAESFGSPTDTTTFYWFQGLKNGVVQGTGSGSIANGSVIGFALATGFDELLVGAYATAGIAANPGSSVNALALDNLRAGFVDGRLVAQATPEPVSLALFGPGLAALALLKRRRRSDVLADQPEA